MATICLAFLSDLCFIDGQLTFICIYFSVRQNLLNNFENQTWVNKQKDKHKSTSNSNCTIRAAGTVPLHIIIRIIMIMIISNSTNYFIIIVVVAVVVVVI